jgi:hypothetical protein
VTEAEWERAGGWAQMLTALPKAKGTRKLRLWCVACARIVLAAAPTHALLQDTTEVTFVTGPMSTAAWFTPTVLRSYARGLDAAELFADRRISRRELRVARAPTGGPWNLFHLPGGHSRLTVSQVVLVVGSFTGEFKLPSGEQLTALARDVFGNPFRPATFASEWRTDTVKALAVQMYESRDFSAMPIIADALQDAGCDNPDILAHCREEGTTHVRGCWVCDLVLGKE